MNTSAWRTAVENHLRTSFPSAEVVGGKVDPPAASRRERDHICVFWPGWDVMSRSTSLAQPTLTIRYSPRRSKLPTTTSPLDPAPLEDAGDALIAAFPRASQSVGYFIAGLSCRLTRVTPNDDEDVWNVEAELQAYTLSGAA